jgi:GTP-binding protein LepA
VEEVGSFRIQRHPLPERRRGRGYIISGIKTVSDVSIGDTINLDSGPAAKPGPVSRKSSGGFFLHLSRGGRRLPDLAEALEKYKLNDAALVYQKTPPPPWGLGFRCGFLGLCNLEIVQERLEREFDRRSS